MHPVTAHHDHISLEGARRWLARYGMAARHEARLIREIMAAIHERDEPQGDRVDRPQ